MARKTVPMASRRPAPIAPFAVLSPSRVHSANGAVPISARRPGAQQDP